MHIYQFKVALEYDKRTYRNIEILGNQTLKIFHDIIFNAFDRDEEHLYSFFITKKAIKSKQKRYSSPEYRGFIDDFSSEFGFDGLNATTTEIASLGLREKDKLYYLFDYGDSWWHEITLLSIHETKNKKGYPGIVKKSGKSPEQYPDYDDEAY